MHPFHSSEYLSRGLRRREKIQASFLYDELLNAQKYSEIGIKQNRVAIPTALRAQLAQDMDLYFGHKFHHVFGHSHSSLCNINSATYVKLGLGRFNSGIYAPAREALSSSANESRDVI